MRHALTEDALDGTEGGTRLLQLAVDALVEREALAIDAHYTVLDVNSCRYSHLRGIGSLGGTQHEGGCKLLGQGLHLNHECHTAVDAVQLGIHWAHHYACVFVLLEHAYYAALGVGQGCCTNGAEHYKRIVVEAYRPRTVDVGKAAVALLANVRRCDCLEGFEQGIRILHPGTHSKIAVYRLEGVNLTAEVNHVGSLVAKGQQREHLVRTRHDSSVYLHHSRGRGWYGAYIIVIGA